MIIAAVPLVAAEGSWAVAFVIFIAFVSLEIPLLVGVGLATALSIGHAVSAYFFATSFSYLHVAQLVGNVLTWITVGITGFWIHRKADGATRKAFLDTRQSMQARLAAHDENDKLER